MTVGPRRPSSDPAALQEQADHVRQLVSEGEIDLAVRRLLDFAKAFSPRRELRTEVFVLSARHNSLKDEVRQFGASVEITRERDRLNTRLLQLVDLIGDVASETAVLSIEPDVLQPQGAEPSRRPDPSHSREPATTAFARARHLFLEARESQEVSLPACRCAELGKTYDSGNDSAPFKLSGVSLELRVGRITGVVAANGHGKTTLLRLLARELKPTSGTLEYPALNKPGKGERHINSQIAYVPQTSDVWQRTLETRLRFTAALFGRTAAENDEHVEFMLHRLGLNKYRAKAWYELSTGFRVRSAIANALLSFPKLLILDEPLANLDPSTEMHFLEDLRDLTDARENPFAVVVTSQHLHEIEGIADDLLFLEDGVPRFYGPKSTLGHDREFNTFEIGCDSKRDELLEIFEPRGRCEISRAGSAVFIVRLPLTLDGAEMLRVLADAGVRIHYFRDISTSTRTMLRIER